MKNLKLESKEYIYPALGISVVALIIAIAAQKFLPPLIPLFYGRPEGEAQLASAWTIVILPVFSLVILVINSLLSVSVPDSFLKKTLVISSLVASILSIVGTVKIVLLVGSL